MSRNSARGKGRLVSAVCWFGGKALSLICPIVALLRGMSSDVFYQVVSRRLLVVDKKLGKMPGIKRLALREECQAFRVCCLGKCQTFWSSAVAMKGSLQMPGISGRLLICELKCQAFGSLAMHSRC